MSRLEVRDLHVAYGKVRALRGVSMSVDPRHIVSIVGANGAGKSTLLKSIMGLLPVGAGEIRFGDLRLDGASAPDVIRAGVAISPEGRRLFPDMDVEENLALGAYQRSRGEAARTLESVYEWFPVLAERRRQRAGSLSGGQQQMVAIGRALMSSPKLLLLDEPSLGLSPLIVRDIVRIIRRIQEKGISVVLVEQNARLALRMSDRAYVMQTGVITMSGTGAELLDDVEVQRAYLGA
ncbi:MAG: ABC transporter ATP-binding protein [Bradyrhizobiaceae bacterium]|nr:MAG: ABC transporter ATP-binding protein [Bradyrhizobiaceae bacterium]